jgi:Ca2+-binding RTX toxin-like protein
MADSVTTGVTTATQAFTNPGIDGPKFTFNNGVVVNGREQFLATPPPLPGPLSTGWDITQWDKDQYLDPAAVQQNAAWTEDPRLGTAQYAWRTADGTTAIAAYATPNQGYVYHITSNDGALDNGGGACVFLQSHWIAPHISFDQQVTCSFDARITEAHAAANALPTQVETGFMVGFNTPNAAKYDSSLPSYGMFIQFTLADTRGTPQIYWNSENHSYIYNANFTTNTYLPFAGNTGAPQTISYNLNAAVLAAASNLASATGTSIGLLQDLSRWSLSGMYIGVEALSGSGATLEVANLSVTRGGTAPASSPQPQEITTGPDGELVACTVHAPLTVWSHGPDTIRGGAGPVTVHGAGQPLVVNASIGSISVDGASSLRFTGSEGRATIAAGVGLSDIIGGSGPLQITASAYAGATLRFIGSSGAATITGGGGRESIQGGTGSLIVQGGSGAETVRGGVGAQSIYGGSGQLEVDGSANRAGTQEIFAAHGPGAGPLTVFGGGGAQTIWGGSGPMIVVGGSGPQDVVLDGGPATVWAGAAPGIYFAGSHGGALLVASGQNQTLVGAMQGDMISASGWNNVLVGGAGAGETISVWRGGDNMIWAGTGDNSVALTSGSNTVAGGTGHATIWAESAGLVNGITASGPLDWVFSDAMSGGGTISGFRPGTDRILLHGADSTADRVHVIGGQTIISLADGATVTLAGMTAPLTDASLGIV